MIRDDFVSVNVFAGGRFSRKLQLGEEIRQNETGVHVHINSDGFSSCFYRISECGEAFGSFLRFS